MYELLDGYFHFLCFKAGQRLAHFPPPLYGVTYKNHAKEPIVCVCGGGGGGHQFFVKLLKVERLHFNDTSVLPKINRIVFSGKIVKTFVQHSYNKQIRIVCVCVCIYR